MNSGRPLKSLGYSAAHTRVRLLYGSAKEHNCLHCGKQARDWAYDHKDPDPGWDSAYGVFSRDPERYIPLCISCHRFFDDRERGGRGSRRRPQRPEDDRGGNLEGQGVLRGVLWADRDTEAAG